MVPVGGHWASCQGHQCGNTHISNKIIHICLQWFMYLSSRNHDAGYSLAFTIETSTRFSMLGNWRRILILFHCRRGYNTICTYVQICIAKPICMYNLRTKTAMQNDHTLMTLSLLSNGTLPHTFGAPTFLGKVICWGISA